MRIRTADPLRARQVLYQLSYIPILRVDLNSISQGLSLANYLSKIAGPTF